MKTPTSTGQGRVRVTKNPVERREELVLGKRVRAGQLVEERRFAGIRVADEGHERDARGLAAPAVQVTASCRAMSSR